MPQGEQEPVLTQVELKPNYYKCPIIFLNHTLNRWVLTEDTGTKSQSTEDLSETDEVKGDQNGSDSESSDSGTNSRESRSQS